VPSLEVGFSHFPAFERAGIKQIINGPFTFAPDGNPLVGPVRGLENYWCACAVMAGFSQGGGVGLALAGWMVNGDLGFDVWGMDVARFGSWADMPYTNAKVRENYSRRFRIRYPNEELTAARQHRTSPLYETLKTRGAVFGAVASIEHALWYAPEGVQPAEDATFRRSNAFPIVAEECKAVRGGVGLIETSTFAKYEVSGPSAGAWLDGLMAGRLPKPGRMALNPLLNAHGRLVGDFTVAALTSDRFFIFGSGVAEDYHMRLFLAQMPASGVEIVSHGLGMTGLSLAGPKSRDVLARVVAIDVSADAFKFMSFAEVAVAGVPALVGRVTFTGDLGFEIWCKAEHQVALFEALMAAGAEDGIQLFGARALKSLSIEKGFGSWATEYRPIYGALETGLDRFVRYDKPAFMGRDAALAERDAGPKRKLCLFDVNASDADCIGDVGGVRAQRR
jgi:dimethylglycine dehydrogenase